jgi:hypothetical protein
MSIEDRLREGLRLSAGHIGDEPVSPEHLWEGVERGVLRASRRQIVVRVATVACSLAIVAATVAWLAWAFTRSGQEPVARPPGLSVQGVRVFGVPDGDAKIYGSVFNRGPQALGTMITCMVLDASGHSLGTVTGSVPYIRAGTSQAFGPLGGQYRGTPSTARCTAAAVAAVSPSPSSVAPSVFQPESVAFWDGDHGILAGEFGNSSCDPTCIGMIQVTDDGGRTWHVTRRGGDHIYDVTVDGSQNAWVLSGPCAMGTCQIHVLFSGDRGQTWERRSTGDLKHVSFVSANEGWGVGNLFTSGSQQLEWTTDGGRNWHSRPVPCPRAAATATDVSFVSVANGWVTCSGVAGAGNADRVMLETTDGGKTWSMVAQAKLGEPSSGSGLTVSGYPSGLFFLPDGHGWMWAERAVGIETTSDGGRSWHVVGTVPNGASTSISSAWFLTDTTGFAVLANGDSGAEQLIETLDGGRSWHVIHSWSYGA